MEQAFSGRHRLEDEIVVGGLTFEAEGEVILVRPIDAIAIVEKFFALHNGPEIEFSALTKKGRLIFKVVS